MCYSLPHYPPKPIYPQLSNQWKTGHGHGKATQVERTTVQLEGPLLNRTEHSLLTFLKLLDLLLQFSEVGGVHLFLCVCCLKVLDSLLQCFLLLCKQLQGEKKQDSEK